jgi:hypothetical protein
VSRDADDAQRTAKFLRGLTIGALLGAVLAGSSIWTRRLAARRPSTPRAASPETPPPPAKPPTRP